MTREEAISYLEFERDQVLNKSDGIKSNLTEAYDMAIETLKKQIPKKPYNDNENGVYEKEHCPTCHRSLFPNEHHCKCGQAITWE